MFCKSISGKITFRILGHYNATKVEIMQEAQPLVSACYLEKETHTSMTETRKAVWRAKMRRGVLEPPKLCTLPPTDAAFLENALRAHLQLATWLSATTGTPPAMDPLEYGWCLKGATGSIKYPTVVPPDTTLAPEELLRVIKCGCTSSHCTSKKCSCKVAGLKCTILCLCRGGDECENLIQ